MGNPMRDGTWIYTWEHGRQLKTMTSMADSSVYWNYTYDANGMRTGRTNGTDTYTYVYNGGQLVSMKKNNDTLNFSYDASGVMSVTFNGTVYQYITNLQGDVVAIISPTTGEIVAEYTYDAWGNILSIGGSMEDTLALINPLRYRGYVYDQETGLYYLQSRYYNPNMGRFINADTYISTGQGSFESNMFAYCLNNPVNGCDPCGTCWHQWNFWDDCEKCGGETFGEKVGNFFTRVDNINRQQQELDTQIRLEQINMVKDGAEAVWDAYSFSVELEAQMQHDQALATNKLIQDRFSTPEKAKNTLEGIKVPLVVAAGFCAKYGFVKTVFGLSMGIALIDGVKWIIDICNEGE